MRPPQRALNVRHYAGTSQGFADGAVETAAFNTIEALAAAPDGRLFVADRTNNRIRVISADGSTVSTYAFSDSPNGLALAPDGQLFVAERFNHRIRMISADASTVSTYAGSALGFADGPALEARFNEPGSLSLASDGRLFVADIANNRIRVISADGATVATYAGSGVLQGSPEEGSTATVVITRPPSVAVGADGSLFFTEFFDNSIRRIDPSGSTVSYIANNTDPAPGTVLLEGIVNFPQHIARAIDGRLFFSDQVPNRIGVISADYSLIAPYAGSGVRGTVNGPVDTAQFNNPTAITVGADGRVFVVDTAYTIRVIESGSLSVRLGAAEQTVGAIVASSTAVQSLFQDADSTLSYQIISGNDAGLFAINSTAGTISVASTPTQADIGAQTLVLSASDGFAAAATSTVGVFIEFINLPPSFSLSTTALTLPEDFGSTLISVTDSDDGNDFITQTLSYSLSTNNVAFATLSINSTSGMIALNSIENGFGQSSITLTVHDGGDSNNTTTQVLSLTVYAVNDTPTFSLSTTVLSFNEDFSSSIQISVTDSNDGDGDFITQSLTYSLSAANTDFVDLSVDPQTGLITITSVANGFGNATVYVVVDDSSDTNNRSTQSFTLTIHAVNDTPTFDLSTNVLTLNEDFGSIQISVVNSDDGDGEFITQTLSYSLSTTPAIDFATLTFSTQTGAIALVSSTDQSGVATLYVTVDDGSNTNNRATQTVTITVNAVNDTPTFSLSTTALTLSENFATTQIHISNSDDGDLTTVQTLRYSISTTNIGFALLSISSQTGTITLSSVPNTLGTAQTVTVTVDDGSSVSNLATRTVSLHIIDTNNPPIFTLSTYVLTVDEDFSTNTAVFVNSSDDGDLTVTQTLSYSVAPTNTGFANLSIDSSGRITISSIADQFGEATIWVVADDSSETNNRSTQSFSLIVNPVEDETNDPPEFELSTTDTLNLAEDFGSTVVRVVSSNSGGNDATQTLSYSISTTDVGFATLSIDVGSGNISITDVTDAFGQATIFVVADDSSETNNRSTQSFTLIVHAVNDAPTFALSTTALTIAEDFSTAVSVYIVNPHDGDIGTQTLSYSLSTTNTGFAALTIDPLSGTLTISSVPDGFGASIVTVTIDDGNALNSTAIQTFLLVVRNVNDVPQFTLSTSVLTLNEDFGTTIVTISSSDDGDDGIIQTLSYSLSSTATDFATLSIDTESGTLTLTSIAERFGTATVTITVSDSSATDSTAVQTLNLVVNAVDDPPNFALSTTALTLDEDFGTTTITISNSDDGDADSVSQTLTYSVSTANAGIVTVAIDPQSGTLTLSSVANAFGEATIVITAADGSTTENRSTRALTLTVRAVDDPPISLADRQVSTYAGDGTTRTLDAGSTGAFNDPTGIAIDSNGRLFVADRGLHQIRVINPDRSVDPYAGSNSASLGYGEGSAFLARFYQPTGLAVNPVVAGGLLNNFDNLFVADFANHRIRRIAAADQTTSLFAGDGSAGLDDNALAASGSLNQPAGIAWNNNNQLYIADSGNGRVRRAYYPQGLTEPRLDTYSGGYNRPMDVAVAADGRVFVADTGNHRIRVINPGGSVSTYAGSGVAGFADGAAAQAQFTSPTGVVVTPDGRLFVADNGNNRIRLINANGTTVFTYAGTSTQGLVEGSATAARFNQPFHLAIGSEGQLFVTDRANHNVRLITDTNLIPALLSDDAQVAGAVIFNATAVQSIFVDPDSALTYSITAGNAAGLFVIDTVSGTVTLNRRPIDGEAGDHFIVIAATAEQRTATASVLITLDEINNPPSFTLSANTLNLVEDFGSAQVTVLSSDDGDSVAIQPLSYRISTTHVGFATLSIDAQSGTITLTSLPNAVGVATISVTVDDGADRNSTMLQTFDLTVSPTNDPPTFSLSTAVITLDEDFATIQVAVTTSSDGDAGIEQTLVYSLSTTDTGFATLAIDDASGTVTITSIAERFGAAVITVTVSDGGGTMSTATQLFTLSVRSVNDNPSFEASTTALTLNEDFDSVNIMLLNEDDGDVGVTQTLSYSLSTTNVGFATLLLDEQARQVGISNIPNQFGMATITITVDDSSDTNSQFTRTVALTVLSVNDRPSFRLSLNAISTLEDFAETIRVSILDVDDGDPEISQALTYSIAPTSTSIADLNFDAQAGTIDISSVDNAFGEITITVSVVESDSTDSYATQSFSLTVNAVNDRPSFTLSTSSLALDEDFGTVAITVTDSNDGDPETTQNLTYGLSTTHVGFATLLIDSQSGAVTIESVADGFGVATVEVTLTDDGLVDNLSTQSFVLTVNNINDAPNFALSTTALVVDEDFGSAQVTIMSSDSGDDGIAQILSYSISTENVGFAFLSILQPTVGEITIQSLPDTFGTATIYVVADDGGAVDSRSTQSFTLTVNSVNDAPSFTLSTNTLVLAEDFDDIAVSVDSSNDGDPETTQILSYSISTTNVGFASLTVNDNTGLIDIRSVFNAFGSAVITVTVSDGAADNSTATQSFSLTAYSVNDTPTFTLSTTTLSLPENFGAITVTVTDSDDGDQGEQTLLYSLSSTDTGFATLSIDENSGEITVITVLNAFGDSVITVTVNDGGDSNNIATQSLSVTVFDANSPPSFTLSTYTLVLDEDFGVNSSVTVTSSNDGDITVNQTLSYSLSTLNTGFATLVIDSESGAITISSLQDAFGSAVITVTVDDSSDTNNLFTQMFTLTVNPVEDVVNDKPIFTLSTTVLSLDEDFGQRQITVTDSDDGDANVTQTLTYSVSTTDIGFATLTINPQSGLITLDDRENAFGSTTITVTLDDGGVINNIASQTVAISVNSVNDRPIFTLSTTELILDEDFASTVQITIINPDDGDPELEQTLSYSLSTTNIGFAQLSISSQTGTISLNSVTSAFGSVVLTVTVYDSSDTNNQFTQSLRVTVRNINDAPSFTLSTALLALQEDFNSTQVIVTDSNNGDEGSTQVLSYSISTTNVGFATLALDIQSGTVIINNVPNAFGSAVITVTVSDGAADNSTATQSFSLTVNPVNDPPVFALSATALTVDEDFDTNTSIGIQNSNDGDEDGISQVITYSINPSAVNFATLSINAQSGAVTINSIANQFGDATIYVVAEDDGSVNNRSTQSFTLTVNPVNDPPVFSLSSATVNVEEDFNPVQVQVDSSNDGDGTAQVLSYSISTTNVGFATLAFDTQSGTVIINNVPNAFGSAVITVTVSDGAADNSTATQSFSLTVNPVNDPPTFTLSTTTLTFEEDFSNPASITINSVDDGDDDGFVQPIAYSLSTTNVGFAALSIDAQSGAITISSIENQFGDATIYVVADDSGVVNNRSTQSFTLTVTPVNDPPTFALSESAIVRSQGFGSEQVFVLNLDDGDEDGIPQPITFTLSTTNAGFATLAIDNGVITITEVDGMQGGVTVYVVADDSASINNRSTQSFSLSVGEVNGVPSFVLSTTQLTIAENFTTRIVTVTNSDDGDVNATQTLTYSLNTTNTGFATLSIDSDSGTITITHVPNAFGAATITVTVNDGAAFNNIYQQTLSLAVTSVNQPPTFTLSHSTLVLVEDFDSTQVSVVDSDDGDAGTQILTYSLNTTNTGFATLVIDAVGTVFISAVANQFGAAIVTVTVNDGEVADNIATQTISITVNNVNDAPIFALSADTLTLEEDFGSTQVTVTNSGDGDGTTQALTYSLSTENVGFATLSIDENSGEITITDMAHAFGSTQVTVTVDDGADSNNLSTQLLTIVVNSVNDAPTFALSIDALVLEEDFGSNTDISVTAIQDVENDALTFSLSTENISFATLSIDDNGAVTIDSVNNRFGSATIYVITDDGANINSRSTQSFTLTVNAVNDAPNFTLSTTTLTLSEGFTTQQIVIESSDDGDGTAQPLTYSLSTENVGFATLSIDENSGEITILSVFEQNGGAVIHVVADDGAGINSRSTQSFVLSVGAVNGVPTFALSSTSVTVDENFDSVQIVVTDSDDGDTDENQLLTYSLSTTHTGFATVAIDRNSGAITITHIPDAFGQAVISVTVSDGSDFNGEFTQIINLTVNAVNQPPTFTLSTTTLTVEEDFAEVVSVALVSPDDGDAFITQTLTYSLSRTNVGFATLAVDEQAGLIAISVVPNSFGSEVITVTVDDSSASNNIATQSFSLVVASVNDAPVFSLSTRSVSTVENFGRITVFLQGVDDGDDGLIQNITYSLSTTDTGFATLFIDADAEHIIVTSLLGGFGNEEITVTLDDGQVRNNITTRSFSLTVNDINNAPTFALSTTVLTLEEDFIEAVTVAVVNPDDGDAFTTQTLTYSLSQANVGFATLDIDAQSGAVTINSVENAFGSTQITVTVNDSSASNNIATQSFSLVVTSVNDAPIFELSTTLLSFNENVPPIIQLFVRNASNGDDSTQSLTYSISTSDVGFASIAIDPSLGTVTIMPVADRFGGAVIYVVADDGGDTNNRSTQSFTLLVGASNNAPSFTLSSNDIVVDEDFGNAQITVTDSDDGDVEEEQTLSYSISQTDVGFATLAIDVSGTITITGIADANGEAVITVTVNDGAVFNNISTQSISLTVRAVNDRPMFTLSTSTLILEENFDPVQVSIASVDDGDGDVTQTLSYSVSQTDVGFATLAIDAQSGVVTINSVQNRVGVATIYVSVDDGGLVNNTATQSFTITIDAVQNIAGLRPTTASDYAGTIAGAANGAALSQAQFNAPSHLALMADNRLLVVDTDNHRIQVVSADGNTVSTYAGGLEGYADGPAASAAFNAPRGIAVALDGRVFVADTNNHRIRVISADGNTVSTYAGSGAVGGTNGFANGSSATARFDLPHGLAVATDGSLFVADTANNRIRVISADGNTVSTYAGDGGTGLINGDAASARFAAPEDVAIAPDGRLFVADTQSHLIRVISADGATVSSYAGDGGASRVDGAAGSAQFNAPRALFAAGSTVFVADTHNDAIRVISADGSTVSTFFTHSDVLGLSAPNGVVVSTDGRRVFATNSDNQRVVRLLIDNSQPVLTVSSSSLSLQEGFDPITVSVIATDSEDGLIDWSVSDGENVVAVTQAAGAITLSDINQTGNVTLTVSAMDSLGATAYERITISVTEAPTEPPPTTPPATGDGGGGGGGGCSLHHTATTDWVLWLLVLLSVVALRRRRYS